MRRYLLAAVLLQALACNRASSPPPAKSSSADHPEAAEIPSDLRESVARAEAFGREIYLQDKAGAIGTDALLAEVKSLEGKGMGGFMAMREGDDAGNPLPSYLVFFYTGGDKPAVRYQVRVPVERGKRPTVKAIDPPRPAESGMATFIRARQNAISAAGPFEHTMNPVMLPDPDGGIVVYLLTPETRPNAVAIGKHYRISLTTEGAVKKVEPLSKGDLEISTVAPDGATPVGLAVSHLVSDAPIETHVVASLKARLPLFVATRRGLWHVDRDKISFVSEKVPEEMNGAK